MSTTPAVVEVPITSNQLSGLKKWGYEEANIKDLSKAEASDLMEMTKQAKHRLDGDEIQGIKQLDEHEEYLASRERAVFAPRVDSHELDQIWSKLDQFDKAEERQLREVLSRSIAHAKSAAQELGRALAGYRLLSKHGEWIPFLKSVGIPYRSAHRFIQIYRDTNRLGTAGVQALEQQGVKFNPSNQDNSHKIAESFVQIREKAMSEKVAKGGNFELEPACTSEEILDFAKQAVAINQPAIQVELPELAETPKTPEEQEALRQRQIQIYRAQLDETNIALRGTCKDDTLYKQHATDSYNNAMEKEMF